MARVRTWFFPVVLTTVGLIGAAGAMGDEDGSIVTKTGTFNEDVFASGREVTVRAQVDADVIVMGGHVDVRSQVSGDVVAMAGELSVGGTVSGDVLATGGHVEAGGRVGGNVSALGGKVTLDAAVVGEVLTMGGRVRVDNRIEGDLKLAGGWVENAAQVGGNVMIAGGKVVLAGNSDIKGNAWAVGGRVEIDGAIGGDLRAAGRHVLIAGEVLGNVHVDGLRVRVLPSARIHGNLTYRSPRQADIHADAAIQGDVTFIQSEGPTHMVGFAFAAVGGAVILVLVALVALGAVQVLVIPGLSFAAARLGTAEPWKALGLGFAILVAAPVAAVILMWTVVGIPLGLVLGAVYLVTMALGFTVSAIAVGRKGLTLLGRDWDGPTWGRIGVVASGLLVIAVVALIPFLGLLVVFLALVLGIGALAVQVFRQRAASTP